MKSNDIYLRIILIYASLQRIDGFFGGLASPVPKIPTSPNGRDRDAIAAIKASISSPKTAGFPLIECEFPPLESLNKLGDGSLRSANKVEQANLQFCSKLLGSISPLPFGGPTTFLLMSSAASNNFLQKAKSSVGGNVCSLRDGIPAAKANSVYVLLSPSSRTDYQAAQTLASDGNPVVIVNGFAKVSLCNNESLLWETSH